MGRWNDKKYGLVDNFKYIFTTGRGIIGGGLAAYGIIDMARYVSMELGRVKSVIIDSISSNVGEQLASTQYTETSYAPLIVLTGIYVALGLGLIYSAKKSRTTS